MHWANPQVAAPRTHIRSVGLKILHQLDPLGSSLSPIAIWSRRRVEEYYSRALSDADLARHWGDHYLGGLQLTSGSALLEHGCGRGRNLALATQLGFRVAGQDVVANPWWARLPASGFQVVPADSARLPWRDQSMSAVLNAWVLYHLDEAALERHMKEVARVLERGGFWIVLEANASGYAARLPRRYAGRLHRLSRFRELLRGKGFEEVDCRFEGFYAPVLPRAVNVIRKQCAARTFDVADFGTWIEARTPPHRRASWLLRLRKS